MECENRNFDKFKKMQLPNKFRRIGLIIAIIFFAGLMINAFTINNEEIKPYIKFAILLGLLLISISKEKIEDEFIVNLRMQSYTFAFIAGVVYAIVMPVVNLLFDLAFNCATFLF